jgi:hypothetical protein
MKIFKPAIIIGLLLCASITYAQNSQLFIEGGRRVINYRYYDPHNRLNTYGLPIIPNFGISYTSKVTEGFWLGAGFNLLSTEIYPEVLQKNGLGGGSWRTFGPNLDFSILMRYEAFKLSKRWRIDLGLSASYCKNFDSPQFYEGITSKSTYTHPDGSTDMLLEVRYDLHRLRAFDIFIKPEISIMYALDERFDIGFIFQNPISFKQTMRADIFFRDSEQEEWKHATIRTNGGGRHYNFRIIYHFW